MTHSPLTHVLQPGRIGSLVLPHRVVMGPMHLGLEVRADGGRALAAFYLERVRGGAGLIVTGGAAVSQVGAGGANYGVLTDPAFQDRLRHVASAVHQEGGLIALQLFHAGRYAVESAFGLRPVGPSPVYSRVSRCEPRELTAEQVHETIAEFAAGAEFTKALGFDAVEIMASEGYLVDQFLSPLTNLRADEWGGDARGRARFGREVLRGVRAAVGPAFPVIVRFTGTDLMPGGVTEAEVHQFARDLVAGGADALNVGIGWHESPVPTVQSVVPAAVWTPVAEGIARAIGGAVPVIAGNRVNRLDQADAVLAGGLVDLVSMSRPFLADAELISRARRGAGTMVCIGCNQACIDRSLSDQDVSCLVNPRAARELEFPRVRLAGSRSVAVVGGGPAGLQAALTLAESGCRVELFEADHELGGQFLLAAKVPGKSDYRSVVRHLGAELRRLNTTIHLGQRITRANLAALRAFDGVALATGTQPRRIELPGVDSPNVLSYPEAFAPGALGDRVVIIGGGAIAVDVAHYAADRGEDADLAQRFRRRYGLVPGKETAPQGHPRSVTILHRGKRLASSLGKSTRWVVLDGLRRNEVRVLSEVRYERIDDCGVHFTDSTGTSQLAVADTVIIAAGQVNDSPLAEAVRAEGLRYCLVGGARQTDGLDAVRAFAEGLVTATDFAKGLKVLATVTGRTS